MANQICFFNPSYPSTSEHRYHESLPHWFECEYCKAPREDMPCFCAYTLGLDQFGKTGDYEAAFGTQDISQVFHTVEEHWKRSCSGFGSYAGPCGDCYECISLKVTYGQDEQFFRWMEDQSVLLKVEYGKRKAE